MGVLVVALVVVLTLALVIVLVLRERVRRARLDRHGLDDLRRLYRDDNPRGPGLEPLIRDQRPKGVKPRPRPSA